MNTKNVCFYKKSGHMACNLKTMKLLDCALKGVCAATGSNMVNHTLV